MSPKSTPESPFGTPLPPFTPSPVNDAWLLPALATIPTNELADFWGAVQCCVRLQNHGSLPNSIDTDRGFQSSAGSKRSRLLRCGACAGCTHGDCGECKNCKDKPKFGGPGIKKQACIKRACINPLTDTGTLSRDGSTYATPILKPAEQPVDKPTSMILETRRQLEELRSQFKGADSDVEPTSYSTDDEDEECNIKGVRQGTSLLMAAAGAVQQRCAPQFTVFGGPPAAPTC